VTFHFSHRFPKSQSNPGFGQQIPECALRFPFVLREFLIVAFFETRDFPRVLFVQFSFQDAELRRKILV
jgi:hypothetical protein